MKQLKPETVEAIRKLMEQDIEVRKGRIWHLINNGVDQGLGAMMLEFREAIMAQEDFDDWQRSRRIDNGD